jgi:hypothetical protein
VILLRGHVQRREPVLRLNVDRPLFLQQQLDHLLLAGQRGDVQSGVALFGGIVDGGVAVEQFSHQFDVAIFAGQVKGVQTVCIGRVDVGDLARIEVFAQFFQVAGTGSAQKSCVGIGLEVENVGN